MVCVSLIGFIWQNGGPSYVIWQWSKEKLLFPKNSSLSDSFSSAHLKKPVERLQTTFLKKLLGVHPKSFNLGKSEVKQGENYFLAE